MATSATAVWLLWPAQRTAANTWLAGQRITNYPLRLWKTLWNSTFNVPLRYLISIFWNGWKKSWLIFYSCSSRLPRAGQQLTDGRYQRRRWRLHGVQYTSTSLDHQSNLETQRKWPIEIKQCFSRRPLSYTIRGKQQQQTLDFSQINKIIPTNSDV